MRFATQTCSLVLACGLALPARALPLAPLSPTDTRVERNEQNAAPRVTPLRGEFGAMRDELESFPVGVNLGAPGVMAPPTSTVVPGGFDWGMNTLRGQPAGEYVRVVNLSGSPVGGNATQALRILTASAVDPGGFFLGANLRWPTSLFPTVDHNARVSAEMYISTIAQTFTFEPTNPLAGFITGRLLWGGVCVEISPGECTDIGLPIGPITNIFVLASRPSDFLPRFYPAAYCFDIFNGSIIPGCVPPTGASVGDPVAPPIGAWARGAAETAPDARVSFYIDRFDGEGEFLIGRHQNLASSFIGAIAWNSSYESQDAFMLVDNIEASGPLYAPLKPPPLDCPYADDLEWMDNAVLADQSDRWDALLTPGQVAFVTNSSLDDERIISQQNTALDNYYTRQFSTELPAAQATLANDVIVGADLALRSVFTVRAMALVNDSNTVARVTLGRRQQPLPSLSPEIFVQINPDYDPIDAPSPADPLANAPVVGVDVAPTGVNWALNERRTVQLRLSANGALRVYRDGVRIYAGPAAFGAGVDRLAFESENNIGASSNRLEVGAIAMTCAAPSCATDFDFDDLTSFSDLNAVLSNFGATGLTGFTPGDANADGVVNFTDLNAVLTAFGTSCQ